MILAAMLVLFVAGGPLLPLRTPHAATAVPDTPGAAMLPEAVTYDVVAADVDGDGVNEIVRLTDGGEGAVDLEAWGIGEEGVAERIGDAIEVGRPNWAIDPGELVFAGTPHRLVARRVDGAWRATLVRQPRFDEPALDEECCLMLHDVVASSGAIELVEVAQRGHAADAVLAIDMDGDRTDELLVTRSLPPLGQTTFPTDARVLRWTGDRFGPPTLTSLGIGSGFSPFVLGDTDETPGDEAGYIAAQSRLHRVSLRDGDALVAESAQGGVRAAAAVPVGGGRGVATISFIDGTSVRRWPRDEPLGDAVGSVPIFSGSIIGVVGFEGADWLAITRQDRPQPELLSLPGLDGSASLPDDEIGAALAGEPVEPYAGVLAGTGDRPIAALGGSMALDGEVVIGATLAGVVPVGLAGPRDAWVVLWHGDWLGGTRDPASAALHAVEAPSGSGVSVVPVEAATTAQGEWNVDPDVSAASERGEGLVVGPEGFVATISAPAGSRVYVTDDEGSERQTGVVPEDGELAVKISVPAEAGPGGPLVELAVVTPGGRAYVTEWALRVLGDRPELRARTTTPIGSSAVKVAGSAAPGSVVAVAGREVTVGADGRFEAVVELPPWPTDIEVTATDPLGRDVTEMVVGVGWFDYRGLPWVAIIAVLVAMGGGLLAVRGARATPESAPSDDVGTLEELDPEEG
jgi:hypothetical protein